jgi:beta-1,4-N-acetylglucosaminyltransferase
MRCEQALVTVGTTQFDELIQELESRADEFCKALVRRGVKKLFVQFGKGSVEPVLLKSAAEKLFDQVEVFRFKPLLKELIGENTLVISHAGAGTILEGLRSGAEMIVVVNQKLMDNHQIEIAEKMAEDGYLVYGTCSQVVRLIEEWKAEGRKRLEQQNPDRFLNLFRLRFGGIDGSASSAR